MHMLQVHSGPDLLIQNADPSSENERFNLAAQDPNAIASSQIDTSPLRLYFLGVNVRFNRYHKLSHRSYIVLMATPMETRGNVGDVEKLGFVREIEFCVLADVLQLCGT